jgi:hypothetical protein
MLTQNIMPFVNNRPVDEFEELWKEREFTNNTFSAFYYVVANCFLSAENEISVPYFYLVCQHSEIHNKFSL